MKNNKSEVWNFSYYNGGVRIKFSESVDIHKAFEAMMVSKDQFGNDDIWMDWMPRDFSEEAFTIVKALAEIFPTVPFEGNIWYTDYHCYCDIDIEFSYNDMRLCLTESFADDDCGYFCPKCGLQVGLAHTKYDEEEIECDDCGEVIKVSDLKYVPTEIIKREYIIK